MVVERSLLRIGAVTYDKSTGILRNDSGESAGLRPQSAEVLAILANTAGEIVSKETLIESVWGDIAVTDDSLTQCIADIRRAIGDVDRKILQTVPKKGYRLIANALDRAPETPIKRVEGIGLRRWAYAVAVLLVGLLGTLYLTRQSEPPLTPGNEVAVAEPSIAVLPLDSVSNSEKWDRLGRGLATDIANELARNDWLYVTAPESTWAITGEPADAGRDLKVRFVLNGSIQEDAGRVRVSAHMTDAVSGEILWSDIWVEEADDVFTIQDHIVGRIGASLTATHTGAIQKADLARALKKPTDSLDAYEHYLIGVELKHTFDPANFPKSIEHLEKAVELDPDFARAWAVLGLVNGWSATTAAPDVAAMFKARRSETVRRAYSLDPDDPEVIYLMAYVLGGEGDFVESGALLRRAVETAPNNADILAIAGWIAETSMIVGGPERLSWIKRSYELNPKAPAWYKFAHGVAAFDMGDYAQTIEVLATAPPGIDRYLYSAAAHAQTGNMEAARDNAMQLAKFIPSFVANDYLEGDETTQPHRAALFEGARIAGIPMTQEDLRRLNIPTVAVMPFESVTGDARWENLAKGFGSEIAGELYQYDTIRTLNLSFAPDFDTPDADAVLTGTVQSDGGTLRVSVTLTDTDSKEPLWAEKWAGPEDAFFDIQDRAVAGIAGALGATWHDVISDRIVESAKRGPSNLDAYENFLVGSYFKHNFTPDGFRKARGYLTRSAELDPDFPKVWAALTYLNVLQAFVTDEPSVRDELRSKLLEVARRAYEAGDGDPDALIAGAHYLGAENRLEEAQANIRRAVALAPHNPDVLATAAVVGTQVAGMKGETYDWALTAMKLNSANPPPFYATALGFAAFSVGDYETVLAVLQGPALVPDTAAFAAAAALELGLPERAEEARKVFVAMAPPDMTVSKILEIGLNADTDATKLLLTRAAEAGFPVLDPKE